jgi:hypothetical protein
MVTVEHKVKLFHVALDDWIDGERRIGIVIFLICWLFGRRINRLVGLDFCFVLVVLAKDELLFRYDQKQSFLVEQYHFPEVSVA